MGRRARPDGGADGVRGGAGAHVGQNGDTPLHSAASGGHEAVVRMLLDAGADAAAKGGVSPRRVGREGAWGGERGRTGALTACAGARARMSGRQ